MSNRREGQPVGKFDIKDDLVIAENPDKPVVAAEKLTSGVLKVKRGEKLKSDTASKVSLEQARQELARLEEMGRQQGGTSQGSAGGGQSKRGGHNYNA